MTKKFIILPGYTADTAVTIHTIIDLTNVGLHNQNNNDEAEVGLIVESEEVEEGVGQARVKADTKDHDIAGMLLDLVEGTF